MESGKTKQPQERYSTVNWFITDKINVFFTFLLTQCLRTYTEVK